MSMGVVAAYVAVALAFAVLIRMHLTQLANQRQMQALLDDYHRAQSASRETESRLRLLLSQVPAMLWTVDRELRVTSLAGAGLDQLQVNEAQAMGAEIGTLIDGDEHRNASLAALRRAVDGEAVRFESHQSGRWLQSDVEPLRNDAGDVVGAVAVMLDVTEIREHAERF